MVSVVKNPTFGSLGVSRSSKSVFKMPANKCSKWWQGLTLESNKHNHCHNYIMETPQNINIMITSTNLARTCFGGCFPLKGFSANSESTIGSFSNILPIKCTCKFKSCKLLGDWFGENKNEQHQCNEKIKVTCFWKGGLRWILKMSAEKAHSVSDGQSKQLKGKQTNDFFL